MAVPRWRPWSGMGCLIRIITGGAAPTRAAMCWTPKIGRKKHILTVIKTVQYTKSAAEGEPMMTVWAVLGGFVLDAFSATRRGCPTRWCTWAKPSPGWKNSSAPACPKRLRASCWAVPLAFCLPVGTFLLTGLVCCWGAARLHPLLGLAVQMFWCGQALAPGPGAGEHQCLYRAQKPTPGHKAVSRIVERDAAEKAHCRRGVTKPLWRRWPKTPATVSRRCSIC